MRQILVADSLEVNRPVVFSADEYHYLVHVLRRRPGDEIAVLDSAGRRWHVELQNDDGSALGGTVRARLDDRQIRFPRITVFQAIPKGRKFDESVRQLVQFGVTRICPVITERTIVRSEGANRTERWQRIAREAVQQSDADSAALISDAVDLRDVRPTAGAVPLLLHPEPLAQTTLHGYLGEIPAEVDLAVGPEGGFTDSEIETLIGSGFQPLWLGPQVLRSESAALFAAAAVRLLVLERNHWQSRAYEAK